MNEKPEINKRRGSKIDDYENFKLLLNNDEDIFSFNKPIVKNDYCDKNLNNIFDKNIEKDYFIKNDFQLPKINFNHNSNNILKTFANSRRENNIFNKNGMGNNNMHYRFSGNNLNYK